MAQSRHRDRHVERGALQRHVHLAGGHAHAIGAAQQRFQIPVSYTHLDVYKRQVLERLVMDLSTEPKFETPGWMQEQLPV